MVLLQQAMATQLVFCHDNSVYDIYSAWSTVS